MGTHTARIAKASQHSEETPHLSWSLANCFSFCFCTSAGADDAAEMVLTALSGSFGGVGSAVIAPGMEDARSRSSGMIMKSLSGSTGALDKAMPRGTQENYHNSTQESLSRSDGGTAGQSDLVASLQADCRGASTQLEPCRNGRSTMLVGRRP